MRSFNGPPAGLKDDSAYPKAQGIGRTFGLVAFEVDGHFGIG